MNIREVIEKGFVELKTSNISSPRLKARMIMQFVLDKSRQYIVVNDLENLSKDYLDKYFFYIDKLKNNVPIEHITHHKEFMKLDFYIDENVLIPRQDTEILVEEVIDISKKMGKVKVLDLCTGSGAISVSIAKYVKDVEAYAVDISKKALEVAKKNAILNNCHDKIKFIHSDMFKSLDGEKFDIIVSNPPYIEKSKIDKLDREVQKEPIIALDGGEDGLDFYREIIKNGYQYLKYKGYICLEIGYNQKDSVISIFLNEEKYENIYSKKDLYDNDRIVVGRLK